MSKIVKLQIQGIRSFDNRQSESIKFLSPLTIVVGLNGSGKTTIIECLKYATTGILPANSKTGGAFIHDPNLCGEKEVMGQVKLQFQTSTGAKMVVTRSLQLIVKKLTRSQKTLEGNLLIDREGERTSISTRVAELDLILPQYLGVSTAVLDNVIFCHQDDSLWPMSDSATLKKKFDEIFEAQKYTKAIENIKGLRKKQNEELAKYKIMEQHAKEDKDRAEKAQKRSVQLHQEIEAIRVQVTDMGERITQARELADKAWKESESYSKILGALEGKRIEAKSKQNTIGDLKLHLKEVPESDAWLESTLDEFESRLEQYQERRELKQEEYVERKDQVENQREHLGQKHILRGQCEHDKAEHTRQLGRRKEMVRTVASRHSLRGYDDLTDDALIEEFMFKIQKISKDQNTSLERARREADAGKRDAQSLVNRLTERKAALQDSKVSAKRQMTLNDREADRYQKQVDQIPVDEGSKALIESRIEDINTRMSKAKATATKSDWDSSIRQVNIELRSYEDDSSRLNNELVQGTKRAGEMARLSHLKQEFKDHQRSLQTMTNTHTDRINKLIGTGWDPESIEQAHQTVLDEATREAATSERDRDAVAREKEQIQFKQQSVRTDISHKTTEVRSLEEEVRNTIDGDPAEYPDVVEKVQSNLEKMRLHSGKHKSLADYFKQIVDAAEKSAVCRVCERKFEKEEGPALARMKNRFTALISKSVKEIGAEVLKEAEAEYQSIMDAAVPREHWKRLIDDEIPTLEQELSNLTHQRDALNVKLEEQDKIVEKRHLVKKELEQISRVVSSIAKCQADIKNLETQVAEVSQKQSQQGGTRTLEDIQQEISDLAEKIRANQKAISQLTTEREQSRSELSSMELELSTLKNDLDNAGWQLDKKATLVARVEDFNAQNRKQRETVDQADRAVDKLEPEISTAIAKYDDLVQRAESQEREMSRRASELSESVNALNLLNEQIKSYIDRGGPGQLADTNREIKRVEQDIKALESQQNETTREINKITEQLRDSENTKRQYSDTLRYRQESRALDALKAEIQSLESRNAEVDRDRFKQESERRGREYNNLTGRQAGLMGEMKSKDVQLVELLADYETDFKDAPKRYKEAHIKVETTKAAVEDLGRYGGALDKAIMKYHSLKMEEINRIIEELWRSTYTGTDVDTIMIKTDNQTATGNRSYSYRVCMVKQDAEMDMRGRCSAGQKVLASIIIRLALAECFGVNCGLIALDEPTTNLDQENIRSLAESLHGIIKYRQAQSNFQLIVITHDEEFLNHIHPADFVDWYYRVSRDPKCNSIIERQSISEITSK